MIEWDGDMKKWWSKCSFQNNLNWGRMVENESTPFCLNEFLLHGRKSSSEYDKEREELKDNVLAWRQRYEKRQNKELASWSSRPCTSPSRPWSTLPRPPPGLQHLDHQHVDQGEKERKGQTLLEWKMRYGWKQNGEFSWYLTIIKLQNDIWPSLNLKTSHYKCCSANLSVRLLSLWVGWIKTWTKFGTLFSKFCWIIQKCALVD